MRLLIALLLLLGAGLAVLYSAASGNPNVFTGQAIRDGVGLAALLVLARVPPNRLRQWTPWIYAASLLLLLLVPVLGTGRSGRHWLHFGLFYVQPAELMKLSVPMMTAAFLHGRSLPPTWSVLAACGIIIGVPAALIAIQPDLGTALLVAASGAFVVFIAGMAWWRIGLLALLGIAAMPLMWFHFLKDYQKQRLLTFLDPESDPLGAGWNIIQSKIAIGSGGLTGKGWLQGTQTHLEFIPEKHTDFIFAVFSEEFGLLGNCVLLLLYALLVLRGFYIAAQAPSLFSRLLAGSITMIFFTYAFVNMGMVSGILPVVGVPLPLLSYGGTALVTLGMGIGILMNISRQKRFVQS